MLIPETIDQLEAGLWRDTQAFAPELLVCGAIVLLLVLRLFHAINRVHLGWIALIATLGALAVALDQWHGFYFGLPKPNVLASGRDSANLFTGLLVYDNLTVFLRIFLIGFAALIIGLSLMTGIPDREDSGDFYCLLLGATLGMSIMASANHLLMVFVGVEMASLPSYALAGFQKGRRQSSEAALKYVVYGGGASGIMLYGISLLAGHFGTAYMPNVAAGFATAFSSGAVVDSGSLILILGALFIFIGIAFKLAAVPFHFWCPDVFEGASAEVAGFLSVASKGAALALLARFVLLLGGLDASASTQAAHADWLAVARYLVPALAFAAALTATFGNLAAYMQTNLKRLLAYSTIAHAGYMMMGLATLTSDGAAAVLSYLVVYLIMNLGAFAVVAFLRNQTGSEDLSAFRGLVRRSPLLVVTLGIFLLSLLGMPPLAGFAAKLQIFSALWRGATYYNGLGEAGIGATLYVLLAIGAINTVLSAVYYIRVLKVMCVDVSLEEVEGRPSAPDEVPAGSAGFATILALVLFLLLLAWNSVKVAGEEGVSRFRRPEQVESLVAAPTETLEARR